MDNVILKIQQTLNSINFTTTLTEDGLMGDNTRLATYKFKDYFPEINMEYLNNIVVGNKDRIKYVTQRINYKYSYRMCSIASALMLLSVYSDNNELSIPTLDNLIDTDKSLLEWSKKHGLGYFINNNKLEQVSNIIAKVLTKLTPVGYNFSLKYLTVDEIDDLLDKGEALITSTRFPGRKTNNKKSGHYIVITNRLHYNIYTIQDPWGMWEDFYKKSPDILTKGKDVTISKYDLFGEWGSKTEFSDAGGSKDKFRIISID